MPPLALRLASVEAPATIAMSVRARALRAQGHDVISLALGEPDFDTPAHAMDAAHGAALAGQTKYPPIDGTPALKQAVRAKFARENGLDFADNEIIVGNGAKQLLFNALMATIDPGSEVVIPTPYWASYPLTVELLGGTPVFAPCLEADGFRLRPEALDAAITPRTRWVILNFPNNPTGAISTRADLESLAAVLERHPDVWILCDEIYEQLNFTAEPHASLAAVAPSLRDRILTLTGVSKTYAMTGWRIGFAGGPAALIRGMSVIQSNATSGASPITQAAAVAALNGDQTIVSVMRDTYRRRRDLVIDALRAIPSLSCAVPEGAFYVYPNVSGLIGRTSPGGRLLATDDDVAMALLEETFVATVPGSAFGLSPYLRLSVASSDEALAQACARFDTFCGGCR
ncbi:pyridoxal phosphate-dependent aminotransferase [Acetobacteraceae bacterium KSS8]|uniref:Aminotransferase n=1 Tax=Endosaccharibacter trunci TaxID=2812733 RepID=A0ABT1W7H2_9PROT|nr:pyridoxal phosphate-dependent aminotransferase [Acetobacteraceae bacterium KSS8]